MPDKPLIALAPMAGVTDAPFRLLCSQKGADFTVSEMISAQGYLTAPPSQNAYRFLTHVEKGEGPVYVQLFGADPVFMAQAAAKLYGTGRYIGVDINMGCPAHKITGGGAGSCLLQTPETAAGIMRAVRKAVNGPVTVKMRLGWDSFTAPQFVRMAQDEGMDMIIVHGRTKVQQYAGKADWDAIAHIKQIVTIPVLLNGDVFTAEDAVAALRHTGCAGLMVGRGALGNPWLFAQIKAALQGENAKRPSRTEVVETAIGHADSMAAWKGEHHAVIEMRKHFAWYIKGMHGAARLRTRINQLGTLAQVADALRAFVLEAGGDEPH